MVFLHSVFPARRWNHSNSFANRGQPNPSSLFADFCRPPCNWFAISPESFAILCSPLQSFAILCNILQSLAIIYAFQRPFFLIRCFPSRICEPFPLGFCLWTPWSASQPGLLSNPDCIPLLSNPETLVCFPTQFTFQLGFCLWTRWFAS